MFVFTKCCYRCGEIKPVEEFHKSKSSRDGLYSWCKTCKSEYRHQYSIDNKDRESEYGKQYRLDHRDGHIESSKRWRMDHPEEVKNYNRQWRAEHLEYFTQYYEDHPNYNRQYYVDHNEEIRDQNKQYYEAHPEVFRESERRRKTRKNDLPFNFTAESEKFSLGYWNNKCAICGKELDLTRKPKGKSLWAFDHWIPLSDPREDNPGTVPTNMLPICHGKNGCNNSKHNSDPVKWLYRKFPDRADEILKSVETYFEIMRCKDTI